MRRDGLWSPAGFSWLKSLIDSRNHQSVLLVAADCLRSRLLFVDRWPLNKRNSLLLPTQAFGALAARRGVILVDVLEFALQLGNLHSDHLLLVVKRLELFNFGS